MEDGTRAHRARLERYIERATGEAVVFEPPRGFAQRGDFSVCCRIVRGYRAVITAPHDLTILYDNRADGHFTCGTCLSSELERNAHEFFVYSHSIVAGGLLEMS